MTAIIINPYRYSTLPVMTGLVFQADAGSYLSYPGIGTVWRDLSAQGEQGVLTNGVSWGNQGNGSMGFDGVNDYVDFGMANAIRTTSTSYEAWIRFTASQSMRTIAGIHKDGTGGCSIGIHDQVPNRIKFHTNTIGANNGNGVLGSQSLNDGNWRQIVGTYDSVSRAMKLYVNGNLDVEMIGPTPPVYPSDRTFNVGRWTGGGLQYFTGNIAMLLIYGRAIHAGEVVHNFRAFRQRFGI